MPTGYTQSIAEGIAFPDFVMQCSRAMGALIMMRDEPSNAPIPERFEPSDYSAKRLKEAQENLSWLQQMPDSEAQREAAKEFEELATAHDQRVKESADRLAKYTEMLAKVIAWEPPSPEHYGFKDFMRKQIEDSIEWDCNTDYLGPPIQTSGAEWRASKIAAAKWDVAYHAKKYAEEVERTESRNTWLRLLRESLAA